MNAILIGVVTTLSLVAALFFLRFHRATHDRFFLFFAVAFAIEGLDRLAIFLWSASDEDAPVFYLLRLLAYGLIVVAILDKNRRVRRHAVARRDRS